MIPNRGPGKLIALEGIDGCGKSTQISLLADWLRARQLEVAVVRGNSSNSTRGEIRCGPREALFTPTTLTLRRAARFADRLAYRIAPALDAGAVVCADRYVFTAWARDAVRGADRAWVREVYAFAVGPDLCFWVRVPPEIALNRILRSRASPGYYEAGMDLNISSDLHSSYRAFQARIEEEYEAMSGEQAFYAIDGTRPIEEQQQEIRKVVAARLALDGRLKNMR